MSLLSRFEAEVLHSRRSVLELNNPLIEPPVATLAQDNPEEPTMADDKLPDVDPLTTVLNDLYANVADLNRKLSAVSAANTALANRVAALEVQPVISLDAIKGYVPPVKPAAIAVGDDDGSGTLSQQATA